jgi:hypothetical protein
MILTEDNRKFIANAIDDAIKANVFIELVDGYVARGVLNLLDGFIDKKVTISDEVKLKLNNLVEAAKDEDLEAAEVIAADILNGLVNIPGLEEDSESLLFEGAVKIIVGAIKSWLAKKVG